MDDLLAKKQTLEEYNEKNLKEDSNKLPGTLDIVKINGRWAQVYCPAMGRIRFLDNNLGVIISWEDYKMIRSFAGWPVYLLKGLEYFAPEEILNIRWGPEQAADPYLKEVVSVFGAYVSKK